MATNTIKGAQNRLGTSIMSADVFSPTVSKQYLSQASTHVPPYERNKLKTEANIKPEVGGMIQIAPKKSKFKDD